MNNVNRTILALVTTSALATSAFAATETSSERLQSARGSVEALSVTLENMGADVDSSVNLNGAYTTNQKTSVYKAKHAELQAQFDELHAQSAE
ncbi:MAG: hypothetical protein ACTH58_16720 [Marinomonas foliarum]|uniref:Uncharacterized protein n=1 Tax=Marinomonas foliarum TaxID=491950 RepID=A0A368ZYP6_9GAMM|nr:hypothetical protein [Marinomonas foliarum]QRV23938.1 hypothetical protein JSY38_18310 [Marinomonas foliarum]RCX02029.1 hypothetical protein DFP77_11675 [Marinomonas foliarum]